MKNIKIAIVLLGLIFTACSGYLDEENLGNTTAENYYTTEKGYEGLVNAIMSILSQDSENAEYLYTDKNKMQSEKNVIIGMPVFIYTRSCMLNYLLRWC